jgi:hypothetical protein
MFFRGGFRCVRGASQNRKRVGSRNTVRNEGILRSQRPNSPSIPLALLRRSFGRPQTCTLGSSADNCRSEGKTVRTGCNSSGSLQVPAEVIAAKPVCYPAFDLPRSILSAPVAAGAFLCGLSLPALFPEFASEFFALLKLLLELSQLIFSKKPQVHFLIFSKSHKPGVT